MKEAFYFSHDNNANQDPKIQEMLTVYGAEGYGWFWMLVELMHQQTNLKLKINGDFSTRIYARHCWCEDPQRIQRFIQDCIERFTDENGGLFATDGTYFWSRSLERRVEERRRIREIRAEAGRSGGQSSYYFPASAIRETLEKLGIERKGSVLYLIRCLSTKKLKIGYTAQPYKRLRSVAALLPGRSEIVGVKPGTFSDEAKMHSKYESLHIKGEWYSDDPRIVAEFLPVNVIVDKQRTSKGQAKDKQRTSKGQARDKQGKAGKERKGKEKKKGNTHSAEFEFWYEGYPRKEDRPSALKAFQQALKRGATVKELTQARDNYAKAKKDHERRYLKYAATFLNEDRWKEFLTTSDEGGKSEQVKPPKICPKCGNDYIGTACTKCGWSKITEEAHGTVQRRA